MKRTRNLLLLAALGGAASWGQSADEKLAPYYPTPLTIVDKMLQLGGVKAGEKVTTWVLATAVS